MNHSEFVNVFQGTGKSVTPEKGSLFSKWNLLKGKAGNTSPSACLPFGCAKGLPGNNDSGGLSACYIWNFLGLFPISEQDSFFLGVPKADKAVLHLFNGNTLTILSRGIGERVSKTVFNGETVVGYSLPVEKIMQGGEIVFYKE